MPTAEETQFQQGVQKWGESITATNPNVTAHLRRSSSIGKLIEALAKAQLEFEAVKRENENPFFKSKYADLSVVIAATQKALAKHGLVILQEPITETGKAGVISTLAHASGEWKEHTLILPVSKQDAQGIGSAITYARRYSYQALVGVAAELDDDGNAAVSNGKSHQHYEQQYEERGAPGRIKQYQVNAFFEACTTGGKTTQQIADFLKTKFKKVQAEEMTPEEFQVAIKWAHSNGDLKQTLETSVKAAKARKPKEPEPEGVPLAWDKQTTIADEDIPF